MSKSSRRAVMQRPVSTARLIGEGMVVLIALAVLCIPGRSHAQTGEPGGCEPQVLLLDTLARTAL